MNEKSLEKLTGLSRRQIIMLQKKVIKRRNKVTVGLSYDYLDEEFEEFLLAKLFKDCGYSYSEIKIEMDNYKVNKRAVLDKAITKLQLKINELEDNLIKVNNLKMKEVEGNEKI